MSKIFDMALDSSCLLCLTSHNGGRWWSPLRQNSIWPSPTPRNFTQKPAQWQDQLQAINDVDFTHDHRFTIKFTTNGEFPSTVQQKNIFYNTSNQVLWGVWMENNGNVRVYCGIFQYSSAPKQAGMLFIRNPGAPLSAGEHTITITAIGNTMTGQLDNESVVGASMFSRRELSDDLLVKVPSSSHDGTILSAIHEDLTAMKVVWSYPCAAERLQLITKSAVRTNQGIFEAAAGTTLCRLATALDLRGNNTSKSFINKIHLPEKSEKEQIMGLLHQGNYLQSGNSVVFGTFARCTTSTTTYHWRSSTQMFETDITKHAGTSVVLATVYDAKSGIIRQYANGCLLGTAEVSPNSTWGDGSGSSYSDCVYAMGEVSNELRGNFQMQYALVFDKTLSDEQIANFQ